MLFSPSRPSLGQRWLSMSPSCSPPNSTRPASGLKDTGLPRELTIADAGTQQWVCAALWPGLEAWWLLGSAATSPTRLSLRTLCQSSCLSVSSEASASLEVFAPSFSPSPLASLCRTPSKILSRSRREENQSGNVERNQKHSQKVDVIRWHRHKYSRARTWQVIKLVFSNITKKNLPAKCWKSKCSYRGLICLRVAAIILAPWPIWGEIKYLQIRVCNKTNWTVDSSKYIEQYKTFFSISMKFWIEGHIDENSASIYLSVKDL